MAYLIGMDEAGYGPNLGPLVIAATVWHVSGDPDDAELDRRLAPVITRGSPADDDRIAVADSKVLYRAGQGLRLLERGVLTALAAGSHEVTDADGLWDALGADPDGQRDLLPWYDGFQMGLPMANDARTLAGLAATLQRGLAAADVQIATIQARAVFPERFNAIVERYGTKSELLSRSTIRLLAEVLPADSAERVLVICDKHGGRNRYAALLQRQFTDPLIEVRRESRSESSYRWGPRKTQVEIRFRTGGEAFLPTALASMTAKYLRELAMRAENDFWCARIPGLRPTAGYPVDARRFKADIAPWQRQLAIDDRRWWRMK